MTLLQAIASIFKSGEVMGYGWIIDTDHTKMGYPNYRDESGVMGPKNIQDDIAAELRSKNNGVKFQMYHDEGALIYSGRIIRFNGPVVPEDFESLDEFGSYAGTTVVHYENESGEWVEL